VRISQYCYFSIRSRDVTAEQISARLGLQPDEFGVRGSKQTKPREIPVDHTWKIACREAGLTVSEQIDRVLVRLLPLADEIAAYLIDLRAAGIGATTTLQVVRHLDDDEGEEEELTEQVVGERTYVKLSGQHQLLGWHLDRRCLDFLERTGAELDVDEYS
jgi:Domain of unknown function (DUF4279)